MNAARRRARLLTPPSLGHSGARNTRSHTCESLCAYRPAPTSIAQLTTPSHLATTRSTRSFVPPPSVYKLHPLPAAPSSCISAFPSKNSTLHHARRTIHTTAL